MTTSLMRRGAVAVIALLVSACATTEYTYTPPTTAKGQACVEKCGNTQQACKVKEDERAAAAQASCKRDANIEYTSCLKYSKERDKCYEKACVNYPAHAYCEGEFRGCYQTCGGTVAIMK